MQLTAEQLVSENVFMQTSIPTSLTELGDAEELQRKLQQGGTEAAFDRAVEELHGQANKSTTEDGNIDTEQAYLCQDPSPSPGVADTQPQAPTGMSDAQAQEEARLAEIMAKLKKWENRIAVGQREEDQRPIESVDGDTEGEANEEEARERERWSDDAGDNGGGRGRSRQFVKSKGEVFTMKRASKEDRREHKRLVKAQKQEARKTKMKKHIKKRSTKGNR